MTTRRFYFLLISSFLEVCFVLLLRASTYLLSLRSLGLAVATFFSRLPPFVDRSSACSTPLSCLLRGLSFRPTDPLRVTMVHIYSRFSERIRKLLTSTRRSFARPNWARLSEFCFLWLNQIKLCRIHYSYYSSTAVCCTSTRTVVLGSHTSYDIVSSIQTTEPQKWMRVFIAA